jgi:inorganic pyrophosphatase
MILPRMMNESPDFWSYLDDLVRTSRLVIDRPRGSRHPRYSEMIYPLDYGYLAETTSGDGHEVDFWLGSFTPPVLDAILVTVDLYKRDIEIKLLLGCTEAEKNAALAASTSDWMAAELIVRKLEG